MTTLLAYLLTIAVLIVIHEYGHYRVARACGVKVLRFSVGFGKVLWRRQPRANGTEFVLSAIPLGGYVRMLDEREGPVLPSERSQAFNLKPLWQRAAIVAAGPVANLLLAVVLYACAHWIGMDEPKAVFSTPVANSLAEEAGLKSGDWVRAVSPDGDDWSDVPSMTDLRWQLTQSVLGQRPIHLMVTDPQGQGQRHVVLPLNNMAIADADAQLMRRIGLGRPFSEPVIREVKPGGPAAKAGLQAGDLVLSIDGQAMVDASQLTDAIRGSLQDGHARGMSWRVERQGQAMTLEVLPVAFLDGEQRIGRVEAMIGTPPELVNVQLGPWDGLAQAVSRTWEMAGLTIKMLWQMITGQAPLKNLTGPLTIADYAGQTVRLGLSYYLGFLAVVSISLGVLNLVPLPMLDGGHLMYYLFEAVTGRPVSELWLERLQRGGVAIVLMVMSLALYNDVARLFLGHH